MVNLLPCNNIIAGGTAALVTAVASHYQVQIGFAIPPETAAAVGLVVAHAWDVFTGQNVPPETQGRMTPPPCTAEPPK